MARANRKITSGKVYEICFRAKRGLPLPPMQVINAVVKGIVARTQRDFKVELCHYTWMANHPHMITVAKDAKACVNFYTEIQRKITEAVKKLLGLDYLELWEGRPMVALLPDLDTVKDRIAYCYSNPSEADLEESIERYPGLTSWFEFEKSLPEITAQFTSAVPWIRPKVMEPLPSARLSRNQDKFFADKFLKKSKKTTNLTIEPNAWMKSFRITDPAEIADINNSIKLDIRQREQSSKERRLISGKKVIGANKLASEPILKPHKPKKKNNKIFVICVHADLRIACIKDHLNFCDTCKQLYQEWKLGNYTEDWPPGAFRPPMPPLSNSVDFGHFNFC